MTDVEKRTIRFVLLGRAVSERIGGTRIVQCTGGWSEELGFVRIYPLHPKIKLRTWEVYEVDVERNPGDNRRESWKLQGRDNLESMQDSIKSKGEKWDKYKQSQIIPNLTEDCIMNLGNEKAYRSNGPNVGRSLGIIKLMLGWKYILQKNPKYDQYIQQDLFGESIYAKLNFPQIPRYQFRCSKRCSIRKVHNCQNLEVGAYEYMRKNPGSVRKLLTSWQGKPSSKSDLYLFMGNMNKQRGRYIVVNPLSIRKGPVNLPLEPYTR